MRKAIGIGDVLFEDEEARESIKALEERLDEGVNGGLPSVSVEDNGKVLKVVGGEWKASPQNDQPLTDAQKQELVEHVIEQLPTKFFSFTLEDDSLVVYEVVVK